MQFLQKAPPPHSPSPPAPLRSPSPGAAGTNQSSTTPAPIPGLVTNIPSTSSVAPPHTTPPVVTYHSRPRKNIPDLESRTLKSAPPDLPIHPTAVEAIPSLLRTWRQIKCTVFADFSPVAATTAATSWQSRVVPEHRHEQYVVSSSSFPPLQPLVRMTSFFSFVPSSMLMSFSFSSFLVGIFHYLYISHTTRRTGKRQPSPGHFSCNPVIL